MPEKIVSGGQTGVDRAALDAAMEVGIEVGGWCPKGRRAVDGVIPLKYPLKETPDEAYETRTLWNVRDSDATLIVCFDEPTGGTALTIKYCIEQGKPCHVQRLPANEVPRQNVIDFHAPEILQWLDHLEIQVLNIAGPREEKCRPIYKQARAFLLGLLASASKISSPGEK